MQLLAAVAEANDVGVVWYSGLGIANLVGAGPTVAASRLAWPTCHAVPCRAVLVGAHPIDDVVGRRPDDAPPAHEGLEGVPPLDRALRRLDARRRHGVRGSRERRPIPPAARPRQTGRPANRSSGRLVSRGATHPGGRGREAARLSRVLFPDGEPLFAESLQERYDRMDLRHAVGVLLGNRDLARHLATEAELTTETQSK
jgi:hypothetical protein